MGMKSGVVISVQDISQVTKWIPGRFSREGGDCDRVDRLYFIMRCHVIFWLLYQGRLLGCSSPFSPRHFRGPRLVRMTVSNRVYSGFAGTALVLSVIPLAWHRTVATCAYMVWTALGCLVYFVDSIVWNGNTVNWAPRWCDICPLKMPIFI